MMPRLLYRIAIASALLAGSCTWFGPVYTSPPIETSFAFTNFSKSYYAALGLRAYTSADSAEPYVITPLLAPGATYRKRFLDVFGGGCPNAIDFRLFLYKRVDDDLPIGLDDGEEVERMPLVAGEILGLPACGVQPLETYTIVNWEAPEGTARVKLAQATPLEQEMAAAGLFPNADGAWEIVGVDPALAETPPPAPAPVQSIRGRVTLTDGRGVEGQGVLIRSRFRVRLDDGDSSNDPDAGYGDPIDFTATDANGWFVIDRPAGAYQVEFFSDDYLFRPAVIEVETPLEDIAIIAEPR
ncbi:MAG: carboxypeptidase regulatory-like domain-containing protein [Phycisphaerales bacterium]|nr:carboxypeptidase regulatory-like domain-containing protein [Phycisphaerales bacterium]